MTQVHFNNFHTQMILKALNVKIFDAKFIKTTTLAQLFFKFLIKNEDNLKKTHKNVNL